MDVALLNRKITVQKNTVVTDAIGNHTSKWEDFYSCYAAISGESPSESTSAGMVVDNTKADFTVRWCKAVSKVTADAFRILCEDEIYNILGIDHQNFKKKSMKLKCQKARR
ncbi:MAG: phage head closure protein [Lachnospiraceae bacterium]|nr:phage head closure protein [Lachnospiraceae bacterium]